MFARISLLLLLGFCLSASCVAGNIVGRWHCPKEIARQLEMGYDDLDCTYRFKRNGKLIIKIKGETLFDHSSSSHDRDHIRRGSIVIKGKYVVADGKISSFVDNKNVETYAEEYNPEIDPSSSVTTASFYVGQDRGESLYREKKSFHLRKMLLVYRLLWDWDEVPYELTEKTLKIGDYMVFTKGLCDELPACKPIPKPRLVSQ